MRAVSLCLVCALGCGAPMGQVKVLGPVGATITLDGREQGQVGPEGLTLRQVPAGVRALRAEAPDRQPAEVHLRVRRRDRLELSFPALARREGAPAPAAELSPAGAIALEQARGFYRRGQAEAALALLGDRDEPPLRRLRAQIERVAALAREAEEARRAGDRLRARRANEALLLAEPDGDNDYHLRAQEALRALR